MISVTPPAVLRLGLRGPWRVTLSQIEKERRGMEEENNQICHHYEDLQNLNKGDFLAASSYQKWCIYFNSNLQESQGFTVSKTSSAPQQRRVETKAPPFAITLHSLFSQHKSRLFIQVIACGAYLDASVILPPFYWAYEDLLASFPLNKLPKVTQKHLVSWALHEEGVKQNILRSISPSHAGRLQCGVHTSYHEARDIPKPVKAMSFRDETSVNYNSAIAVNRRGLLRSINRTEIPWKFRDRGSVGPSPYARNNVKQDAKNLIPTELNKRDSKSPAENVTIVSNLYEHSI